MQHHSFFKLKFSFEKQEQEPELALNKPQLMPCTFSGLENKRKLNVSLREFRQNIALNLEAWKGA